MDLARGHVAALRRLFAHDGSFTVNLGTGKGYSVLEAIRTFEKASGRTVPYEVIARRPGDIASCYANPTAPWELFGWHTEKGLEDMCAGLWRWQRMNPTGSARLTPQHFFDGSE